MSLRNMDICEIETVIDSGDDSAVAAAAASAESSVVLTRTKNSWSHEREREFIHFKSYWIHRKLFTYFAMANPIE